MRYFFIWRKNVCGFTLTELMIAISVIAILAALGYPAYQEYVRKGRLAVAQQALLDNAAALERHYANHMNYKKNSTTWMDLPIMQTEHFCIRMQGNPRGTNTNSNFTIKAVALNQKSEPRALILNQDGAFLLCQSTTSSCSETAFFANPARADKQCASHQ